MRVARWLIVAALVSFGPHPAARASEDPGELAPLPEPPLERMEPAVRKQLEEARATVDSMLASSDAPPAQRAEAMGLLGRLYLGYGLSGAAEVALRNAQRLAPDEFAWTYYLGTLYQHERRVDAARTELHRALELRPEDVPALLRLGEVELAAAERFVNDQRTLYSTALAAGTPPGEGHRTTQACADCHDSGTHAPGGNAFACTRCHEPHGTDNTHLVVDALETVQGPFVPIRFDNLDGRADGSFASASQPGTGICEVCHTTTAYYRADGGGAAHFDLSCLPCHRHAEGFAPQ